jgi:hypothetical protein
MLVLLLISASCIRTFVDSYYIDEFKFYNSLFRVFAVTVSCVAFMMAIIILAITEAGDLIRNLALGGRIVKILQYSVIMLHNGL